MLADPMSHVGRDRLINAARADGGETPDLRRAGGNELFVDPAWWQVLSLIHISEPTRPY